MRTAILTALTVAVAMVLTAQVSAQWFKYPTPGVPRTASGALDANAPTPRTADGKPDLSGVWLAGNPLPCPPLRGEENDRQKKTALPAGRYHIAPALPGGLPYQPWAAAAVKQ